MRFGSTLAIKESLFPKALWFQKMAFVGLLISLVTSMSGMEIFSSLVGLGVLVCLVLKKPPFERPIPFLVPILAFVAIVILGVLWGDAVASDKWYDISRMRFFLIYILLFLSLKYYVSDVPWIKILASVCCLVGIYGFIQHFVPLDLVRPEGRKVLLFAIQDQKIGPLVVGTFNHHLTFANIFLFYACLFLSIGVSCFRKYWFFALLGGLFFLLCAWTQSRVAWAAIPFSLLTIAWGKGKRMVAVCMGVVLLSGVGLYMADEGFRQRFDRTLFQKNDFYNLGPRSRLWKAQWEMFKEHPIVGMGYNNNERRSKEYVDRLFPEIQNNFYGHAHSAPLQILSTTGILGLVAYLFLWGAIFLRSFRLVRTYPREKLERWMALGILAGFVGFQIQGLTQWNFGDAEVLHNVVFFWALIAVLDLPSPVGE